MPRVRRLAATAAAAIVAVTVAAAGVSALTPPDGASLPLATVPEGVSAHDVGGRPVFLVRRGRSVSAFLRTSPFEHTNLVWCPADNLFLAPTWGEMFDIDGRAMSGHPPRNMDRVHVVVRGSTVTVEAGKVTRGARPRGDERRQAISEWLATYRRQPPVDWCSPTVPE